MTNYSPSPWKVVIEKMSKNVDVITSVVASNGEIICDDMPYGSASLNPKNAQLIAAAPEMFELLPELRYKLLNHADLVNDYGYGYIKESIDKIDKILKQLKQCQ